MSEDIHYIRPIHEFLHDRLLNWSRYVRFDGGGAQTTPMFRHYRSYRGWHPVTPTVAVDTLDAIRIEKEVSGLPEAHRDAIRWFYVYAEWGMGLFRACRQMAVRPDTMCKLCHDARSMLNNRLDSNCADLILRDKFNPASAVPLSPRDAEPTPEAADSMY